MSTEISILGPKDMIQPFQAMGLNTVEVDSKNVRETLQTLLKSSGIIFISEEFIPFVKDIIDEYSEVTLPAIIPIPGSGIERSFAIERLNELIKKAVGVEIHREE